MRGELDDDGNHGDHQTQDGDQHLGYPTQGIAHVLRVAEEDHIDVGAALAEQLQIDKIEPEKCGDGETRDNAERNHPVVDDLAL